MSICVVPRAWLDGWRALVVDGFHVEANAALASLRASLKLVVAPEGEDEEPAESGAPEAECEPSGAPQLSLVAPGSGSAPKRKSSTSVSLSDPDSKLRHKPSGRIGCIGVAVDPQNLVIQRGAFHFLCPEIHCLLSSSVYTLYPPRGITRSSLRRSPA
jgi:hypothetical protein